VPEGFEQGYQTLADETELFYQMSREYEPAAARGVRWDDPALAIKWPPAAERIISDRDLVPAAELVNLVKCGSLERTSRTAAGGFTETLPPARAALPRKCVRRCLRHAPPPRHTGRLPEARVERMGAALATARTPVVSRDSHLPGHERADEGLQMFDPGSPTEGRPAQIMGIAVSRLSLGLNSRLAKPLRCWHPRPGRVPQAGSPRLRWLVECG
jgi:hypothetical protein